MPTLICPAITIICIVFFILTPIFIYKKYAIINSVELIAHIPTALKQRYISVETQRVYHLPCSRTTKWRPPKRIIGIAAANYRTFDTSLQPLYIPPWKKNR